MVVEGTRLGLDGCRWDEVGFRWLERGTSMNLNDWKRGRGWLYMVAEVDEDDFRWL